MATVNLGRIKPVFRGAYDNSTSYVVDDIVTFGNETFIAIQAGSGNATSNASYWTKLAAKGADGSDGTDVGTTLTTQGDILYRDGSGLQRLGAGTSGQVLQTGGSGANPSWTTMSSDYVKLHSAYDVAAASEINLNGFFNDNYTTYRILASVYDSTGGGAFYIRMRTGTNCATEQNSGNYHWAFTFRTITSGGGTQQTHNSGYNNNEIRQGWNGSNFGTRAHQPCCLDITLHQPTRASRTTSLTCNMSMWDNAYFGHSIGSGIWHDTTAVTGIKLHSGANIAANYVKILGYKD